MYVGEFEERWPVKAKRRGHQGVVCGPHSTAPRCATLTALYCNDGDWVESCTALVEAPRWSSGTGALADAGPRDQVQPSASAVGEPA